MGLGTVFGLALLQRACSLGGKPLLAEAVSGADRGHQRPPGSSTPVSDCDSQWVTTTSESREVAQQSHQQLLPPLMFVSTES